jgi:hypothetical protein
VFEEGIIQRDLSSADGFYQCLINGLEQGRPVKVLRTMTSYDGWLFPKELCHMVLLGPCPTDSYSLRFTWYPGRGFVTKAREYNS